MRQRVCALVPNEQVQGITFHSRPLEEERRLEQFSQQTNVFVEGWGLARRFVLLAVLCAGWRCALEQLTQCAMALKKSGVVLVPLCEL